MRRNAGGAGSFIPKDVISTEQASIVHAAHKAGVGPLGAAAGYTGVGVACSLCCHSHRVCSVGVQVVGVVVDVVSVTLLISRVEFVLLVPVNRALAHPEVV